MVLKEFTMKKEHLLLLSRMYTAWNPNYSDMGAPTIDSKRPYGNSGIFEDIDEILTGRRINEEQLEGNGSNYDEYVGELYDQYEALHKETETALQIVLQTQSFELGKYQLVNYGEKWFKA